MKRERVIGIAAGVGISALLMALDANDFSREPATDTADGVATAAVIGGAALWLALRWANNSKPLIRYIRAAAAGIAIGALVIGLASVVYDPFAN